jgi:hypothetical protein
VSLVLLVSCDRTRSGQPCRAFLPVPLDTLGDETSVDPLYAARESAVSAGWNLDDRDTCPSRGHDEETA